MFELAHNCARDEGMEQCVEMLQQPQYITAGRGYNSVTHQQEVDSGNFDDPTTVIQSGRSPVTARTSSTENSRFNPVLWNQCSKDAD